MAARCAILLVTALAFLGAAAAAAPAADSPRRIINLDGTWEIAEGGLDAVPAAFSAKCPVPGLVDMAKPAFEGVGPKEADDRRAAFWYRRTFTIDGPVPAVASLKVHKAAFTTRVFLNGKLVGDHEPNFTPGTFDLRPHLKGDGQPNELVVRVGSSRKSTPAGRPDGWDFEKIHYIPGIYDSVEVILSGTPHITSVQVVPDVEGKAVRVVAVVKNAGPAAAKSPVRLSVREAKTGREVGSAEAPAADLAAGAERTVDLRIPIKDCRLWSPEDPFLYELETSTGADTHRTRFGVRSFRFDPETKRGVLNGKPYMLRGTNICIYRFFEDPVRGSLPWDEAWVRRCIRAFRDMHWNSCRYCIGFPPEMWYRIADEEGLLVQDEFPVWSLDPKTRGARDYTADLLAEEYAEWMRERWNHPCVIIWDAQNESKLTVTGEAMQKVRGLDLSDRPWDNGWAPPVRPTDVYEAHPYLANKQGFTLATLGTRKPVVGGNPVPYTGANPIVINEYGWMWVNRDGTPTTLSVKSKVYEKLLPPGPTADQIWEAYARVLAAKTEYWRSLRPAGVLHFCGLGYARAGGETSDNFVDVAALKFEPHFYKYVRDSFAPVGLMVDFWEDHLHAGEKAKIRVGVINDLAAPWQGDVTLRLTQGDRTLAETKLPATVPAVGREVVTFNLAAPAEAGKALLTAELKGAGGETVRSLRDLTIQIHAHDADTPGIAGGKPVTASSVVTVDGTTYSAANAVDGDPATYWSSEFSDPAWLAVDLGETARVKGVWILWEKAYAKAFQVQVSADGKEWKNVFMTLSGEGGTHEIGFPPVEARHVRILGTQRGTKYGYGICELKVFKE